MYVSVVIARWWAIRTQGVGAIVAHCENVSGLLISSAARVLIQDDDWELFKKNHAKLVKYGLASLSCVAQQSRSNDCEVHDMHDLVVAGLLTESEVTALECSRNKPMTLWCWLQGVAVEMGEMCSFPPPTLNMLYTEIRMGTQGIHLLGQYLSTQLPFPYVHMIILLVNLNALVGALCAGAKFAVSLNAGQTLVCAVEFLQYIFIAICYQGLLQVCVYLSDPLGDDIIDFLIGKYQYDLSETCKGQLEDTRKLFLLRRKEGLTPLPKSRVEHGLFPVAKADPVPQIPVPSALVGPTSSAEPLALLESIDQKFKDLSKSIAESLTSGIVEELREAHGLNQMKARMPRPETVDEDFFVSTHGPNRNGPNLQQKLGGAESHHVPNRSCFGCPSVPIAPIENNLGNDSDPKVNASCAQKQREALRCYIEQWDRYYQQQDASRLKVSSTRGHVLHGTDGMLNAKGSDGSNFPNIRTTKPPQHL